MTRVDPGTAISIYTASAQQAESLLRRASPPRTRPANIEVLRILSS